MNINWWLSHCKIYVYRRKFYIRLSVKILFNFFLGFSFSHIFYNCKEISRIYFFPEQVTKFLSECYIWCCNHFIWCMKTVENIHKPLFLLLRGLTYLPFSNQFKPGCRFNEYHLLSVFYTLCTGKKCLTNNSPLHLICN